MNDEQLHRELRGTDWQNYSLEIVDHYPQLLERLAPRYAKIKKSLEYKEEDQGEEKEEEDDN